MLLQSLVIILVFLLVLFLSKKSTKQNIVRNNKPPSKIELDFNNYVRNKPKKGEKENFQILKSNGVVSLEAKKQLALEEEKALADLEAKKQLALEEEKALADLEAKKQLALEEEKALEHQKKKNEILAAFKAKKQLALEEEKALEQQKKKDELLGALKAKKQLALGEEKVLELKNKRGKLLADLEAKKQRELKEEKALELKNKREQERKKIEILSSFSSGIVEDFKYYYLAPYYPVNKYSSEDLSSFELNTRRELFNFKDGNFTKDQLNKISELIKNILFAENNLLCIIPASNPIKTQIRYENFLNDLCASADIKNGYYAIVNNDYLEASHSTGKKHNNVNQFEINHNEVIGKNIILIDDVITKGTSFKTLSKKLKASGAKSITGVFICKTSYKNNAIFMK